MPGEGCVPVCVLSSIRSLFIDARRINLLEKRRMMAGNKTERTQFLCIQGYEEGIHKVGGRGGRVNGPFIASSGDVMGPVGDTATVFGYILFLFFLPHAHAPSPTLVSAKVYLRIPAACIWRPPRVGPPLTQMVFSSIFHMPGEPPTSSGNTKYVM